MDNQGTNRNSELYPLFKFAMDRNTELAFELLRQLSIASEIRRDLARFKVNHETECILRRELGELLSNVKLAVEHEPVMWHIVRYFYEVLDK